MENNIKPIVKDNLYDASNFTDWIDVKYGEMKCFLAYVDDNNALTRINEVKANFDENSTSQYLELQVSFDKKGIIREVIMLIQEKIGDEWTDPERIGGHFFDSKGNVIGHEFLSEKEFAELEAIARQAYAARYLIDTDSYDEYGMIKKGDKLIIVCEALQDEINDTVLVKLNSSMQSSMVMLTENVKKAPKSRCNLKGITEEDFGKELATTEHLDIVTCKDCKHRLEGSCLRHGIFAYDSFYCKDGERNTR